MSRRVTIFDSRALADGRLLVLPDSLSLEEFFSLCAQKLSFPPTKAVLASSNAVIDDPALIRDSDQIILSGEFEGSATAVAAEPVKPKKTTAELMSQKRGSLIAGDDDVKQSIATAAIGHKNLSIAVMGAGGTGKSALTLRFVQGKFVANYDPTIEDAFRKTIQLDGCAYQLNVLDTAGQDDYASLRSSWMRSKDGFLFVFSLVEKSSFNAIKGFYTELQGIYEEELPPVVLIGNKSDLCDDSNSASASKRAIPKVEAENLAKQFGARSIYVETSAATGDRVDKAFESVVRLIEKSEKSAPLDQAKNGKKKKFCSFL